MSSPLNTDQGSLPSQSAPAQTSQDDEPWDRSHLLLSIVGSKMLNDYGYINLKDIRTDSKFGYDPSRTLPAAEYRTAQNNPHLEKDGQRVKEKDRIHPVFRRARWNPNELIEKNWDVLRPVLQLATLLLEDVSMAPFIAAMIDIDRHRDFVMGDGRKIRKCFRKNPNFGQQADLQKLWQDMATLLSDHRWVIMTNAQRKKHEAHGVTWPVRSHGHLISQTAIDPEFFDVLCGLTTSASLCPPWKPGTDEASARLRIQFMLALTMVHELMHALNFKLDPWRTEGFGLEPFYIDTRLAELGSQWEREIFGGGVLDNFARSGSPLGLGIYHWPGALGPDREGNERMSYGKWGRGNRWCTVWAIHMSYIHGIFTHKFWADRDRFGPGVFEPKRLLGARRKRLSSLFRVPPEEAGQPDMQFEEPPRSASSYASTEPDFQGVVVDRVEVQRWDKPGHPVEVMTQRQLREYLGSWLSGLGMDESTTDGEEGPTTWDDQPMTWDDEPMTWDDEETTWDVVPESWDDVPET